MTVVPAIRRVQCIESFLICVRCISYAKTEKYTSYKFPTKSHRSKVQIYRFVKIRVFELRKFRNQLNKSYRTLALLLIVICNIPNLEKALLKPGKRQKNDGQVQTIYMKNVKCKNFHVYSIDIRFIRYTVYIHIYI